MSIEHDDKGKVFIGGFLAGVVMTILAWWNIIAFANYRDAQLHELSTDSLAK